MLKISLIILLSLSGFLGYQLVAAQRQLRSVQVELGQTKSDLLALSQRNPASKSWLQARIVDRNSALERGAYNQKSNVAHAPGVYYADY